MTSLMCEDDLKAEAAMIANVERGAVWLDSINPVWFLQINTEDLDLKESEFCICGQIFCEEALQRAMDPDCEYGCDNGYEYAKEIYFDYSELEVILHGFQAVTSYTAKHEALTDIIYAPIYRNPNNQYEFLGWEWVRQINARIVKYGDTSQ